MHRQIGSRGGRHEIDDLLSDEDRAGLNKVLAQIQAREYERDVLAPRRAAEDAQRQREAALEARRQREYNRAAEAALLWRPDWKGVVPQMSPAFSAMLSMC